VNGDKQLEFKYDYMGRRVEKKVYTHNGSQWNLTTTRRFVYADWLLVLELDGENDIVRKYTWGLDLAGQNGSINSIDAAGGIGGLLATYDAGSTKSYLYFYDANGNVGQLLDRSDGSPDARYEYDAYGNTIAFAGDYADDNPFRFSTKCSDAELDYAETTNDGLYYFGYRYYSPRLGRWMSRDPIGELDDILLLRYANNAPNGLVDALGLSCERGSIRYRRTAPVRLHKDIVVYTTQGDSWVASTKTYSIADLVATISAFQRPGADCVCELNNVHVSTAGTTAHDHFYLWDVDVARNTSWGAPSEECCFQCVSGWAEFDVAVARKVKRTVSAGVTGGLGAVGGHVGVSESLTLTDPVVQTTVRIEFEICSNGYRRSDVNVTYERHYAASQYRSLRSTESLLDSGS
jgi:RHS repeat-associated protein